MDKEQQVLDMIRANPTISQRDLAKKVGVSSSVIASYLAALVKKGKIKRKAYGLSDRSTIICIGGANIDRKIYGKQKLLFGTSNPATLSESCGGVARNISENLSRLGFDVILLTGVGDDKEGQWLIEETKKQGIDVSQVWSLEGKRTGTYTALLDYDGEMIISFASMEIYEDITPGMIEKKWPYIASAFRVILDANLSPDCLAYVIERCRKEEIPLYINPVSFEKAKRLPSCLQGVEAILSNREEAEVLSNMKIETVEDYRSAALAIHSQGVKQVVITLGKDGVFYSGTEGNIHIPSIKTDVIDVTGAGDSFVAGFVFGILQRNTMIKACKLGLAAAHLTLQTKDSVSTELSKSKLYTLVGGE